eukprot:GHUV01030422.1.p1 GENE.GHUV01030422.1~~GHUV01030422.1.p1  ORF type:complete len:145 (-),score=64.79 GHUV01030422.1:233-667(-)
MSTLQVSLPTLRFINTKQAAGSQQADITATVMVALQQALMQSGVVQDLADVAAATDVFLPTGGGAASMCQQLQLQLLGRVPLDPLLGQAAEEGRSVLALNTAAAGATDGGKQPAPSAAALQAIVKRVIADVETAAAGVVNGTAS